MDRKEEKSSYSSENSCMLDLPITYGIEEYGSSMDRENEATLNSVSLTPETDGDSENTNEYKKFACPFQTPSEKDNSLGGGSKTPWTSQSEETPRLEKDMDIFYHHLSQPEHMDRTFHLISEVLTTRISEIKQMEKNEYSLRCFQMACVLLHSQGTKIFLDHLESPYSSESLVRSERVAKCVLGLSMDVVTYVLQNLNMTELKK
ncbi:shieldin complex subunit 1-like [Erpetoichthys calabaricus]|uniref:shieldin complex subunit 1-like n=1 Tax=Erpetoichthys calabaricus TaxID=27687 RepID=UPI00109FFFC3|nr:shieldin complex subunit 1-like [Erpetoichthys calabaricus]